MQHANYEIHHLLVRSGVVAYGATVHVINAWAPCAKTAQVHVQFSMYIHMVSGEVHVQFSIHTYGVR